MIATKAGRYRNFPMVPRVVFGKDSFTQLGDILLPKRKHPEAPFIFLVDDVFKESEIATKMPLTCNDQIVFVSANEEPKTVQVDVLVQKIQQEFPILPSGIIGIGGGTLLDLAKAVSIALTNEGSSAGYQGWDLVKKASIYHVGIPTISGTGAEVSRTAVLTGPTKKMGINSDHTTFDQVILDPNLTQGVCKEQWFYTGMDCFIHCIESLNGTYLNAFSQSYGEKALELCKDVFLGKPTPEESRDKLMMAFWHGGMSIAYFQVGAAHAMTYGLGYLLGVKHGIGNCLVFQHLDEFYPIGVKLFNQMQEKQGICAGLSDEEFDTMIGLAMAMQPLWENAIVLNDFARPWENTLEIGTEFKALYDSKNLFLKYDVIDDHILTSETSKDKQEVAKGGRVEIFFRCDSDLKKYYCLEVAPNGGVLDYAASHYRKFEMNWHWPQEHLYVKVNPRDMGYCVELTLSLQSLQELGVLKEGILRAGIFRADCFSLGAEPNENPIIEWISWIDPETAQPDFHVPTAFGTLILE